MNDLSEVVNERDEITDEYHVLVDEGLSNKEKYELLLLDKNKFINSLIEKNKNLEEHIKNINNELNNQKSQSTQDLKMKEVCIKKFKESNEQLLNNLNKVTE